jgi:hypothetical protein
VKAPTAVQGPKSSARPAAAGLIQRTCACGNHTSGGSCAECEKKRIQPRLAINTPGDEFEREADRVADEITSAEGRDFSRVPTHTDPSASRWSISTVQRMPSVSVVNADAPKLVQRAMESDEVEAEAAEAAATAEPSFEAGDDSSDDDEDDEGYDDGDVPVQAKHDTGALLQRDPDELDDVRRGIDRERSGGSAIETPVRERMESAFGADFSGVRVHTNSNAAALAGSIRALAFTTGRDIFFGPGRYQPESAGGRHLLAHELTHVVQQGAATTAAVEPQISAALQRDPDDDKAKNTPKMLGTQYFFDRSDNIIIEIQINATADVFASIRPGYYELKMTARGGGVYLVKILGVGSFEQHSKNPARLDGILAKTKRIFLRVYAPPAPPKAPDEEEEEKKEEEKPTPEDVTGPEAPPGTKPDDKPDAGTPPPAKGGDAGAGQQPDAGDKGGDKGAGEKGEAKGGDQADMSGEGDKKGAGKGGAGSKYGWLGLFDLPAPLIKIMEGALDVLGDSEELLALRDTLQTLQELAEHRDELGDMFKDPETLLEITLGLKENAAITAIEAWVAKDVKTPKPAKTSSGKGIVGLALKILALVRKLRRMLKPVFKVRGGVQSALGAAGMLLEAIPVLEHLLELTKDPKAAQLSLVSAADQFATEFAAELKPKIDKAPKQLKEAFVRLEEADLVSYEVLARGVTAAVMMAVPKTYKPIVWIARKTGLEQAIADNVVAPLIPKEALDGVNDVIRELIKAAEPTFNGAVGDLEKIIAELAPGFLEEMPKEVLSALKPSLKTGRAPRRPSPAAIAGLLSASTGEPLDEDTRTDAETRLGHVFGGVRVHRDAPAAAASELLHAHAFTVGSDVFFGPGKFAPESAGGRRLLYHELTHTAQQAGGGLDLQPDYKDLLARLTKRFTARVIEELKGAKTTSPAKQKQIDDIRDKVTKIIGRTVTSRTNPKLPTGYTYIPKDKGKIKTIRRSLAWIRFIPALTIDKSRKIRLAVTLSTFSPGNAARAALRAALGCDGKTQQAHHCIPLELFLHSAVKVAVKNGFKFNGVDNGVCISNKIHSGSHPKYTTDVRTRLNTLLTIGTDWTTLQKPFLALVASLKSEVKARRKKLN